MPTNPPSGAPGAGDPSMEEILASIRKILDEEEGAAKPDAPPTPEVVRAEEVPLELTEEMIVAAPEPAPPPRVEPLVTEVETVSPAPPPPDLDLVAPATAAAAAALIGQLARTVAQERASPVSRGGPSIEDVVREELRPLLREWLEAHLPPLVERLVRAEIERVVGRSL